MVIVELLLLLNVLSAHMTHEKERELHRERMTRASTGAFGQQSRCHVHVDTHLQSVMSEAVSATFE